MPLDDIRNLDRRIQWGLLVVSLATLVLMIVAALEEGVFPQWRSTRAQYAGILQEKATDDRGRAIAEQFDVRLVQNVLPELGRIDRCITCHAGIDDPRMTDEAEPFRTHPGDLLEHHPPDKYGCTICHQGQGRAIALPDAHGTVPFWPEPLLAGAMAYTSCGRCHYENDLYAGESDLFGPAQPAGQVTLGELATHVPGAEQIARGKRLVVEHGCLGCHKYRARGGTLGPDISHVGDKTVHDFDFKHVSGERSVLNWMRAHFKSPAAVVPDTLMPDMGLSDEEASDLAAYMISLKRKSAPAQYTPLPEPVDPTPADGRTLYLLYCSSCHGADGVGAVARESETHGAIDRPRELLTPSLRNDDTLAVASDDYLRAIIAQGRSGTGMPAWLGEGGLSREEIERLVEAIRSWQDPPPPTESIAARRGNSRFGRALYRSRCVGCHGYQGEGGVGVSLGAPSFLAVASDEFLRDTILHGRPNTAMPSWPELSADEVSDLIAYVRSWQPEPPTEEEVLARLAEPPTTTWGRRDAGDILYRANCANCHGRKGDGDLGPSLNTVEFLSAVDDAYLSRAIVEGRPDTAMPSWKHLPAQSVADLIRTIRKWGVSRAEPLEPFMARGDWDRGQIIFQGACAGCHGFHAEGSTGPQLANPTFLRSASDAMLRKWISYGKLGTAMKPFLVGQQGVIDLTASQIEDVVTFLRHNESRPRTVTARPGMGIVALGAEVFAANCVACHGANGEGLVGSALSNPNFLRSASDGFLSATIVLGRENTPMVSLSHGQHGIVGLTGENIADVVAFLRSWEYRPPDKAATPGSGSEADERVGKTVYAGNCAGCHGAEGNDGWAPALNNPEFLAAATDGFLKATVARGRSGTAMRPFGRGGGGLAPLTGEEIENVVSYLRSWQRE